MLRKKIIAAFAAILLLFSISESVTAQDSTVAPPPLKISGSVDGYYRFNFSNGDGGVLGYNNSTSFTGSNNVFQLGMASVKAEYTAGKVGVVADLGFGPRAEEFSYADAKTLQAIKQAYIYYSVSDKVKFTFGKFGTHVGYELLDPQLNKNYSMSYMFTNGPFSHTGLKADFALGGGTGLMLGVANPIDVTAPSNGDAPKTLLAQVSHVASKFSLYLNYAGYFGAKNSMPTASSLNQIGLTASATISDKFSIGYDGTVQLLKNEILDESTKWWGSALYFNLTASDKFGLTLRGEYFGDEKYGIKVSDSNGDGVNVFAATLSGNYKVGNFTLIPEFRLDNASSDLLYTNKDGDPTKSTSTFLVAAVFSF
jgi:Putative beta-barrel porin-2, OmpL-like. bbp2